MLINSTALPKSSNASIRSRRPFRQCRVDERLSKNNNSINLRNSLQNIKDNKQVSTGPLIEDAKVSANTRKVKNKVENLPKIQ